MVHKLALLTFFTSDVLQNNEVFAAK